MIDKSLNSLIKAIIISCIMTVLLYAIGNRWYYADSFGEAFPFFEEYFPPRVSSTILKNEDESSYKEESNRNMEEDREEEMDDEDILDDSNYHYNNTQEEHPESGELQF